MADDNDGDDRPRGEMMRSQKLLDTTIVPGRGAIYGKGSSGEGALDYSPGDNEDSEGGSSGSGWRGGNPQRSQGSTPAFRAVQAPNRPK